MSVFAQIANFNGQVPRIDPDNAVMLLIDHQSGLFQTVHDMPMPTLRSNATTLARIATLAKMPVITTASVPQGPNGPLIPEITNRRPRQIRRPQRGNQRLGQPGVRGSRQGNGQETADHRRHHHQRVHGVSPASPPSPRAIRYSPWWTPREPTPRWRRKSPWPGSCRQASCRWTPRRYAPKSSAPGTVRTAEKWAEAYSAVFPDYQLLIESYLKAQAVVTNKEQLDSPTLRRLAPCRPINSY